LTFDSTYDILLKTFSKLNCFNVRGSWKDTYIMQNILKVVILFLILPSFCIESLGKEYSLYVRHESVDLLYPGSALYFNVPQHVLKRIKHTVSPRLARSPNRSEATLCQIKLKSHLRPIATQLSEDNAQLEADCKSGYHPFFYITCFFVLSV
jgi:hypothetical protein